MLFLLIVYIIQSYMYYGLQPEIKLSYLILIIYLFYNYIVIIDLLQCIYNVLQNVNLGL